MSFNLNLNHFFVSPLSTYNEIEDINSKPKYFFISENHDDRSKTALFIEGNYNEGDLVLAENFMSMCEIDQNSYRSTRDLKNKIKLIGWDIPEMSVDSDFPSGSVSEKLNKLSIHLADLFKNYCGMFDSQRKEIIEIISLDICNEIEELHKKQRKEENEITNIVKEHNILKKYNSISNELKIDIKKNEIALNILAYDIPNLIDTTINKIEFYNENKEKCSLDIDFIEKLALNFRLLNECFIIINWLEKKSTNHLVDLESCINSERIRSTFQDRTISMIQTLEKVSSSAKTIFVVAGMNHFIEGQDALQNPEMSLHKFHEWLKDKSALVLGLK